MNEDIVKLAKQEIATLQSSVPKGSHVKTGDIRKSPAILKNDYADINPLEIANRLLNDENDLVCKGYGWMLKALSKVDEELVIEIFKGKTVYYAKSLF